MNIAILTGRLSRPAELRSLPSGDPVLYLDVTIPRGGEPAETVNVCWFDAPASATSLDVDDEVIVLGRVRRRFYRSGPLVQSRTEVVAESVVRVRRTKQRRAVLERALTRLEEHAASV